MKKLNTSLLVLVLTSSIAVTNAQQKKDTMKTKEIEGVVVTALGIKREKRALGYSTTEVKGDQVSNVPVANVSDALAGQVAGLNITQSGTMGGSANVVIRGIKSLTSSNQALIVVDGTPINNDTFNQANMSSGGGGYDYANGMADINPNDIESVNVLKGAAASALYGSRGMNGVVMITTKKGKKSRKIGVEFNSSITLGTVDKSTLPKYQHEYGGGTSGKSFYNVDLVNGYPDINGDGILVWERELDIYVNVRREKGVSNFIPFQYQGQYYDDESNLCYNRFRYYDVDSGLYISKDPVGLMGGFGLYNYVKDINVLLDILGLMANNTAIGDMAEKNFVEGLEKRGWKIYTEIKNGSQNGIDVVAQHPLTKKVHVFEVKANTSRLSVLQKGDDYIQNILDEIRNKGTLRGQKMDVGMVRTANIIDRDIKAHGIEGRLIKYKVNKTTGDATMTRMSNWPQKYR